MITSMQTNDDNILTRAVVQPSRKRPVSLMIQSSPPSPHDNKKNQSQQQHYQSNQIRKYKYSKQSTQNEQQSLPNPEQKENLSRCSSSIMIPLSQMPQKQQISTDSENIHQFFPKIHLNRPILHKSNGQGISFISTQPLILKNISSIQLQLQQINDQQQSIDKPQEQQQSNKGTEQQSNIETEQQKDEVEQQQSQNEQYPPNSVFAKLKTKFSSSMSQISKSQPQSFRLNKTQPQSFKLPTLDLSSILKTSSELQLYEKPAFSQFSAKLIPFSQLSPGSEDSQYSSDNVENFWTISPQQILNKSSSQSSSKSSTSSNIQQNNPTSPYSLNRDQNTSCLIYQKPQSTPASIRLNNSPLKPQMKLQRSVGLLQLEPLIRIIPDSQINLTDSMSNG